MASSLGSSVFRGGDGALVGSVDVSGSDSLVDFGSSSPLDLERHIESSASISRRTVIGI